MCHAVIDAMNRDAGAAPWRAQRGQERRAEPILRRLRAHIAEESRVRLDYAAVVDARTLNPLEVLEGRVLIPIAAWLGSTRLIDNLELDVKVAS